MNDSFGTVTLIGVGLLGGSIGLALKERGLATRIRGVGHRQSSLDTALDLGAIDEAYLDVAEAMPDTDLVIIATPAALVLTYLDTILPLCGPDTLVTDVASTKGEIAVHASATWPTPRRFVGAHPMAGSEKFGPEHATADLYEGAVTFLEQSEDVDPQARERLKVFWESLGCEVVDVKPMVHDALVARTSHVPHITASALSLCADLQEDMTPFVGGGFRDATRIAEGRAEIWRDIALTNAVAIRAGLGDVIAELLGVVEMLDGEDGDALDAFFTKGAEARRNILDS